MRSQPGDAVLDALGRRRCASTRHGLAHLGGQRQSVAHGGQVPGPAAAEGQARQGALYIGAIAQLLDQRIAQRFVLGEELDHVEALADGRRLGQRCRQMRRQQARAGAGDGAVDDRKQVAPALAAKGLRQLQVAPCGGVHFHHRTLDKSARRSDARHVSLLGQRHIVDQRPAGGQFGA